MIGFIKLYREILDWQWYGEAATLKLFLHLLLTVNYCLLYTSRCV